MAEVLGGRLERLRRRWSRRALLSSIVVSAAVLAPREANAQVHWDASAQAGVMRRFFASSADPGFGPAAQLNAHVALLPLLYAGGYFSFDMSPMPRDVATRNVFSGGVRLKGILPWVHAPFRAWVFAGLGYTAIYAPSYSSTFDVPNPDPSSPDATTRQAGKVEGGGGTLFEVPFGIGASYKLFPPWELCAELGGRVGFANSGTIYDEPGPGITIPSSAPERALPAGLDRFAVGLTVGVLVDL